MNFNVMFIVVLALCLGCISVLAVSEQAKCAPASVAAKECLRAILEILCIYLPNQRGYQRSVQ